MVDDQGPYDLAHAAPTAHPPPSAARQADGPRSGAMTRPVTELKMVGWYDVSHLLRTAVQVLTSTVFGRHADHRLLEALACDGEQPYDYTHPGNADGTDLSRSDSSQAPHEFWIDYVSDVGDGWDSTYAVAYYLAQEALNVHDPQGQSYTTQRGAILIFGGDEVYPTPSPLAYEQRLVVPYEVALRWTDPLHPHAYAIPGNHDWYDSLVSYTRLFCSRRWFAGWTTQQQRSYFALKLPRGWWLLGTDVQLGSDLDQPQVAFFERVAAAMQPGDRVILCNAEPYWIRAKTYQQYDPDINENNLAFLEQKVLGKSVSVFIAGDLHHYRRHAAADGTQKITAGGGGAFLHPTHGDDVGTLVEEDKHRQRKRTFHLMQSFPDPAVSRRLCWRNLLFPYYNPTFGLLTGILYVLTAWALLPDLGPLGLRDIGLAATATLRHVLSSPLAICWLGAVCLGFVLFTDTHSQLYRGVMGPIHGLVHTAAACSLGWGAASLGLSTLELAPGSIARLWVSAALIFSGGWLVGSCIMGLYLLVSLNVFGRHANEAFSSLKVPDWKHFLRLKIDAQGDLTIYPIGIRRVPRRWQPRPVGATGPERVPADRKATQPALIESPITVKHSPTQETEDIASPASPETARRRL